LYGFLGNDGINQIDDLGLMKDSDIDAYVKGLDAVVSPRIISLVKKNAYLGEKGLDTISPIW
jgi:hypothetical protein